MDEKKIPPIIPYGRQEITAEDINAVIQVLESDFLTQGPSIVEFEKKFADYIGVAYAVAVANGTAALHLCALALGVNKNTKVITTPITFAASANCIQYCGGKVYFSDIDTATGLIDIKKLKTLLKEYPKGTFSGIIPVDFAGYPVNMEEINALAKEYNLWVIEDACHAPGGYFLDSKNERQNCGNGKYADLSIFSFHPVKHIATGEGGMITTNNKDLYEKLCLLRTHGISKDPNRMKENHGGWYYEMLELGYNYRLSDMQAALGISQLKRAQENLERRRAIAQAYDKAFEGTPIKRFTIDTKSIGHAYHLYVIQVEKRKELYNYLKGKGIFAQVHYIPVHTMPYYRQQHFSKLEFENAEKYYEQCLSIPMYPSLKDTEQQFVIDSIKSFYNL